MPQSPDVKELNAKAKAPAPSKSNLTPAIEKRRQELEGQQLTLAQPTKITLGKTTTTLSGMPPDYSQFAQDAEVPETPSSPYDLQDNLPSVKNWDRLTPTEQWVMQRLPGWADSFIGRVLERFGNHWVGKALAYLDVGAEAIERTAGLAQQAWGAKDDPAKWSDFSSNLKEAWYAGSLAYDYANTVLEVKPNDVGGLQFSWNGDLPGTAGVVDARRKIVQLVDSGVPIGEALAQTRAEGYESLGALAIRAQANELIGHILIDPINFIGGFVKPVERTFARKFFAVTRKASPEDLAKFVAEAEDAVATAAKLEDELRLANESGDAGRIANALEALAKADEVKASKLAVAAEAVANRMTRADQFVVWATGETFGKKPGKAFGLIPAKWNPFSLTLEARAEEYTHLITENVSVRIVPAFNTPAGPDVEGMTRAFIRGADGVFDPKLGALPITKEGRAVISLLKLLAPVFEGNLNDWTKASGERELFEMMARVLGEPGAVNVAHQIQRGDDIGVFTRFMEKLRDAPEDAAQLERWLVGQNLPALTAEGLGARAMMLKNAEHLLDARAYTAELLGEIASTAMKHAVVSFGVTHKGFFVAAADLVKSAETLAFLRLNPTYPMRNYFNNVVTLIARGGFGLMTQGQIGDYWKLVGFKPSRLSAGIGAAGLELGKMTPAELEDLTVLGKLTPSAAAEKLAREVLGDATRSEIGWLNKMTDGLRGVKLGKLDMGALAQKIESAASEMGMTIFFMRGERMVGRVGKAIPSMESINPGLASRLGSAKVRAIERAIESVHMSDQALMEVMSGGGNIRLNMAEVVSRAEAALGRDISLSIPAENIAMMETMLNKALKDGNVNAVRDAFANVIRPQIEKHLDDLLSNGWEAQLAEATAYAKTGKADAFTALFGEAVDDMGAAMEKHALVMSDLRLTQTDAKLAHAFWQKQLAADSSYFRRAWDGIDNKMAGLKAGATEAGMKQDVGEVLAVVKDWRASWNKFIGKRNALWNDYHEARLAGLEPPMPAKDIQFQLDTEYAALTKAEDLALRDVDALVSKMLPQGAQRDLFLAWRNRIANMRLGDKEEVAAFMKRVRTLPADQVEAAWVKHWLNRKANLARIYFESKMGKRALAGDPEALALYQDAIKTAKQPAKAVEAAQPTSKLGIEKSTLSVTEDGYTILDRGWQQKNGIRTDADLAKWVKANLGDGAKVYYETGSGWLKSEWKQVTDATFTHTRTVTAPTPTAAKAGETVISDTVFTPKLGQRIRSASGNTEGVVVDILPSGKFKIKMDDGQTVIRQGKNWTLVEGKAAEATTAAVATPPLNAPALPDFFSVVNKELIEGQGLSELFYLRGDDALNAIEEAAIKAIQEPPMKLGDGVSPEDLAQFADYLEHVKGGFSDARYFATRFAEWGRDSALLNYNRRYNYNTWLGTILPYEFWMTQSAFKWALHSIDRPAMLATYLRMKKFLDTAYREEEGLPSRLRGMIRIPFPFVQDYMGTDLFVDPFRLALPFDSWASPFEAMEQQEARDEGAAMRKLYEMAEGGEISQQELEDALMNQAGSVWDRAVIAGRKDDTQRRLNWADFALMLSQPHVPLLWAYNLAADRADAQKTGRETEGVLQTAQPGALLPITATIGKLASMFGLDPAGIYNPEAAMRKAMGLHPFNKWDTYYTERALVNMIAMGYVSAADAKIAMIEHSGQAYEAAVRVASYESAGGPIGFALGLTGIPVKAYPPGEEYLRKLKDDYAAAWQRYDDSGGDYKATVGKFLEEHPGYEARLALFKKPEERLYQFVTDEFWNKWNDLPTLNRNQVREALGSRFETFLSDKDARKAVSVETLAAWLKVMGGDPPGALTPNPDGGLSLDFAPPDVAYRAQVFYDTRNTQFPGVQPLLDEYFAIDPDASVATAPPQWVNDFIAERKQKYAGIDALLAQYDNIVSSKDRTRFRRENPVMGEYNDWVSWYRRQRDGFSRYFTGDEEYKGSGMDARRAFMQENPLVGEYLDWRRDWLLRNPDVVPYLVEDPDKRPKYESAAAYEAAQANQPGFTWEEWRMALGWPLSNLVADYDRGEALPPVAREQLTKIAAQMGFEGTPEEFAAYIKQSTRP